MLNHTRTILGDIENEIENGLDEYSPIINDYLIKHIIIVFSSEMEAYLKKYVEDLIIKRNHTEPFKLCRLCHSMRNPKFKDIKTFCKSFNVVVPCLDATDRDLYTGIINTRDSIAHDIHVTPNYTINQVKEAVEIAESLIDQLEGCIGNI